LQDGYFLVNVAEAGRQGFHLILGIFQISTAQNEKIMK
jgi:hypothetical protein